MHMLAKAHQCRACNIYVQRRGPRSRKRRRLTIGWPIRACTHITNHITHSWHHCHRRCSHSRWLPRLWMGIALALQFGACCLTFQEPTFGLTSSIQEIQGVMVHAKNCSVLFVVREWVNVLWVIHLGFRYGLGGSLQLLLLCDDESTSEAGRVPVGYVWCSSLETRLSEKGCCWWIAWFMLQPGNRALDCSLSVRFVLLSCSTWNVSWKIHRKLRRFPARFFACRLSKKT